MRASVIKRLQILDLSIRMFFRRYTDGSAKFGDPDTPSGRSRKKLSDFSSLVMSIPVACLSPG